MFQKLSFWFPIIAIPIAMMLGATPSKWWVYLLVAAIVDGFLYLLYSQTSLAKEYQSGYVVSVEWHYAWRERVVRTETKYDSKTNKSYTVKRVEYVDHPNEYYWILNTGRRDRISRNTYAGIVGQWRTFRFEIDVYHHNLVSGGGGEQYDWDGVEDQVTTMTYRVSYYNPLRYSHSVFSPRHISKQQASELGLFDRPELEQDHQVVLCQSELLAEAEVQEANRALQVFNALEGRPRQIHAYILLFPASKKLETTAFQRDYWEGLHKNEFVVCLGVQDSKVVWCNTLSWMDTPTLDVAVKDYFFHNADINLLDFIHWLRDNLDLWKRKEFHDFEYLGRNLSLRETILYWGATLLLTALCVAICVGIGK